MIYYQYKITISNKECMQTNPTTRRNTIIFGIIMTLVVLGSIFGIITTLRPLECLSQTTVSDIISVEGRNATIVLGNGETIHVHGAYIKKGDNYCLSYKRSNEFFTR